MFGRAKMASSVLFCRAGVFCGFTFVFCEYFRVERLWNWWWEFFLCYFFFFSDVVRETSSVFSLLVCCRFTLNVCCARSYVLFPFFVADNLNFFLMYLSAIFAVLLLFFLALSPTYLTSCLLFMCVCCRFTLNVCWAHSFLPVRVVSIFCCCCCCFFFLDI